MLLRKVINAQEHVPYNQWDFDLECGHRLEWVRVRGTLPKRKRCPACELVQHFAATNPGTYSSLLELSAMVPVEDQARAMMDWISHVLRAADMGRRIPGLDGGLALCLTAMGGTYPFPLHLGDGNDPTWIA